MLTIFKKMLRELLPYVKYVIPASLLGLAIAATKSVQPKLIEKLAASWSEQDQHQAVVLPLVIAGIWIIGASFRYFHLYWMKYVAELIGLNLRRRLMDKYLSLHLGFFQGFEKGSGGLISRLMNDIFVVQTGITRIADIMREPFIALAMFIYLVVIDWKLFVFITILAPIVTGIMRSLAKSLRKYGHRNQETMEDLTKILKESLDGTRIVQAFNLEDEMRARFEAKADEYLASKKKIIGREEASGPLSESLASVSMSLIFIYIGHQIIGAELEISNFLGFIAAVIMLQDSIKKLQDGYIKIQQSAVALDRVYQILETENPIYNVDKPIDFPSSWDTIEFKNVTFAFRDRPPVLKNINLTIKRGQIVALVGSSGGGKSTLINLLLRFYDPTEGSIEIGGIDIRMFRLAELRRNLALVSQDVFLFGDSIEKNIHAGDFEKPIDEVPEAAAMANAEDFIMKTEKGFKSPVGDQGSLLSGGEKQRVSIARAIFKNAEILLLDEATSALDSESEQAVQKGLDRLLEGRTAFVIAHRLSTIANADRILVLKDGQIVEDGPHELLISHQGEYARLSNLSLR